MPQPRAPMNNSAHAHEQITLANEELTRLSEQLTKMERDAARPPSSRPDPQSPPRRPALPVLVGLPLAACIVTAALVFQSSYGGGAKLDVARWVPQSFDSLLPPEMRSFKWPRRGQHRRRRCPRVRPYRKMQRRQHRVLRPRRRTQCRQLPRRFPRAARFDSTTATGKCARSSGRGGGSTVASGAPGSDRIARCNADSTASGPDRAAGRNAVSCRGASPAAARFDPLLPPENALVQVAAAGAAPSPAAPPAPTVSQGATPTAPRPAPTTPQDAMPSAAAALPDHTQLLQTIATDLANMQRDIERLKANQQQTASDNSRAIEQIKASQEEMKRQIARISEQKLSKTSPPPMQPTTTSRKPQRRLYSPYERELPPIPREWGYEEW